MSITPLPEIPSRTDPATFATKGDAFLGALPQFVAEANALLEQCLQSATTLLTLAAIRSDMDTYLASRFAAKADDSVVAKKSSNNVFSGENNFTNDIWVPTAWEESHATPLWQSFANAYNSFEYAGHVLGTTYTNTGDSPWFIMMTLRDSGAGGGPTLTIDGKSIVLGSDLTGGNYVYIGFPVPPDSSYSVTATGTLLYSMVAMW